MEIVNFSTDDVSESIVMGPHADVTFAIVLGAPLPGLGIDDDVGPVPAGHGPEGIRPGGHTNARERDRRRRRELRRGVRAGAPHVVVGQEAPNNARPRASGRP